MKKTFLLVLLFALTGCGTDYEFKKAQRMEKEGYAIEAGVLYEKIATRHPGHPRAPEAVYRVARIYQKRLKMYSHAHRYFNDLLKRYPNSEPWTSLARTGLLNSPDYFPLTHGSFWIEGDSQSGGRNMRAEWTCREVSTGTFEINRRISAGSSFVTALKRFYRKKALELCETESISVSAPANIILSYPFTAGRSWKTVKNGKAVVYAVISENVPVKVKAGEFSGCIKISEEFPELQGSRKYTYYAPEVGWVLTTTAGAGGREHRNTELLSYKINPEK